jgi:subtilase family serine protease
MAVGGPTAASASEQASGSQSGHSVFDCRQPPAGCYTPQQIRVAYGIQPLLDRGIEGRGETVVMPELAAKLPASSGAYTDIRQDLGRFDRLFNLPAPTLRVVTSIAGAGSPYLALGEEVEDTEIVHAIAPDAAIVVVLVPSNATANAANFTAALTGVLRIGVAQGAAVVSISGSHGEPLFTRAEVTSLHTALRAARDDHITVVASSGDSGVVSDEGPPKQVSLPASDPLVLSVGGTSLDANTTTGTYLGEMAWNTVVAPGDDDASAGGFSQLYARPSYQDGVTGIGAMRGVPDVSADANPAGGMALATLDGGQNYTVDAAKGTSAATPLWAAVVALADQEAGHHLGFVNAALYRIGLGASYDDAFHDVVAGDNSVLTTAGLITGYQTVPGWDPVTGWGSPDAQVLVPLLRSEVRSGDGQGL